MCGITGLLAFDAPRAELSALTGAMNDAIAHRGPDDSGVEAGERWALGMRRLAIIDLSANGHQPMQRGHHTMVFNGEVYNYRELRTALESEGVSFVGASDTEVVVEALRLWGPAALPRFNGMFALVLVDDERRRALVARDRWGKKPLFLARLPRGLAFASELKAIHAVAPPGALTVDRSALASYFRYQYVPGASCIYEQVEKLPAASYLEVDLDTGSVSPPHRYWRLPEPAPASTAPTELANVIRAAVARRLVSDRPLGAFLSGGIDSSIVVGCMAQLETDVRTFSIGFADPRFDESPFAAEVASRFGTRHTSLILSEADALAHVPHLGRTYDEPFADSSAIPTMAVSELARSEVVVALSGDGGDELFGGYRRYETARFIGAAAMVPRVAGVGIGALAAIPRLATRAEHARLLADARSPGAAYRELISLWRSRDLARLVPGLAIDDTFAARFDGQPGGVVERMMRTDAETYLTDAILQKVDRASMRFGLEARNPLLDPAVVEAGLANVATAERSPGAKRLLRDVLLTMLPAALVDRPKKGFAIPVSAWLRGALRPLVEDAILGRDADEYDSSVAHAMCRAHLDGRHENGAMVWTLLAYELWRAEWAR